MTDLPRDPDAPAIDCGFTAVDQQLLELDRRLDDLPIPVALCFSP